MNKAAQGSVALRGALSGENNYLTNRTKLAGQDSGTGGAGTAQVRELGVPGPAAFAASWRRFVGAGKEQEETLGDGDTDQGGKKERLRKSSSKSCFGEGSRAQSSGLSRGLCWPGTFPGWLREISPYLS